MAGLMNVPGLRGILEARAVNERSAQNEQQQQMGQLQQMGALQQIMQRQQEAQEGQQLKGYLAKAAQESGGDRAKFGEMLMKSGHPKLIELAQKITPTKAGFTSAGDGILDQSTGEVRPNPYAKEPKPDKPPEIVQLMDYAATLPDGDPRKALIGKAIDSRTFGREEAIRLAAALRPPTPDQPLQAYTDPITGKAKLGTRAEAHGNAPAVRETAERVVPQNIAKAYQENSNALRKIDTALSEVGKYPEAFGLQNMRGDAISQRVDPKGVTARAIVADIGSLKIHDRSGAAVTAAETPRLLPFIPNVNDNAATIKKKLALFRKEYDAIQNDIGSMYSPEQGYKALPSAQSRSTDKPVNPVDALLEKYK